MDEKRKEVNIFNNYILYTPKNNIQNNIKVNTINYINLNSKDNISNNFKPSFNSLSNKNNYSPYNLINRYDRYDSLNSKQEKKANDNNNIQKISLPSLNMDTNKNKRSSSSSNKYNKNNIDEISSKNLCHNSLKICYSHSQNGHENIKEKNQNVDNDVKINLLSSISKSSNILIPIVSKQSTINNYNWTDENNENNIRNLKYKYKISRLEENNKNNNMNDFIINKVNNSYNRNKLLIDNNNFNSNFLINIDRTFMSKLHKIKIEKGMSGNKIYERFNRNIFNKENNCSKTSETNFLNGKLPLISKMN